MRIFKQVLLLLNATMCFSLASCNSNSKTSGSGDTNKHVHDYKTQTIQATCMIDGYTLHYCSCGDSFKDSIVHASGHNYVEREQNYKCSKCDRYEDEGFTFELITSEMAKYNDAYKGRVNTYDIKSVSSTSLEGGIVSVPRKHLGCEVTGIYRGAFYNVGRSMVELRISSCIKYIGSNLICYDGQMNKPSYEIALEKIYFNPNCSEINISHSSFQYCKKVNDVSMPNECISRFNHDDMIGNHFLFEDTQYYMTNKTVENGLSYLFNMLLESDKTKFNDSISIKNGTRIISNYSFQGNTNLKTITMPSSLVYVGKKAFAQCVSLSTIIFNGTESQFNSILIEDNSFQDCKTISYEFN